MATMAMRYLFEPSVAQFSRGGDHSRIVLPALSFVAGLASVSVRVRFYRL